MTNWNSHQLAIFDELENGAGDLVVEARAGTGKTTTMIKAISRLVQNGEKGIVAFAFNASIAKELGERLNVKGIDWKSANAKTLHSAGNALVRAKFSGAKLNKYKALDLARIEVCKMKRWPEHIVTARWNQLTPDERRKRGQIDDIAKPVRDAVSLAKSRLVMSRSEIVNLIWSMQITSKEITPAEQARLAVNVLKACANKRSIERDGYDFDDMVWLPHAFGLEPMWKSSFVFVDEAQDMNPAQIELAKKHVDRRGRLIAIGDSRQAIYGWRGADSGILGRMARGDNTTRLSLPVTYRCGSTIVEHCNQWVEDFEAGGEHVGVVETLGEGAWSEARPGDFILSRTNAPLTQAALSLLSAGKAAIIQGRSLGATLAKIARSAPVETADELLDWLDAWELSERDRLFELGGDDAQASIDMVIDKANCIRAVAWVKSTAVEVIDQLEDMFDDVDAEDIITLSTVHRAKGMERDTVWILKDTFTVSGDEEDNIKYVAASRAKHRLVYC